MLVEKLTASKRVNGRYYAEFDDGKTLRVTELLVIKYALAPQRELTDEEYEELCAEAVDENARARALRILGSRMLSRGELKRRLIQLGETEDTAEETAEWMCDIGLLDDAVYARQIVESYRSRGYGPKKLRDELYKRFIPRDLWDEALETQDEDAPTNAELAAEFLAQKLRGDAPDRDDKRRLGSALARRGFSWDDISEAFSLYAEGLEEDE